MQKIARSGRIVMTNIEIRRNKKDSQKYTTRHQRFKTREKFITECCHQCTCVLKNMVDHDKERTRETKQEKHRYDNDSQRRNAQSKKIASAPVLLWLWLCLKILPPLVFSVFSVGSGVDVAHISALLRVTHQILHVVFINCSPKPLTVSIGWIHFVMTQHYFKNTLYPTACFAIEECTQTIY